MKKSLAACAVMLALAGCSQNKPAAEKKKEPEKPAEAVTGRYAFYQMYTAARAWSADIEPLKLNSIHLQQVKADPGEAAAWQVTFVSPRMQRARTYTYSVIEAEGNLHKGVFAGLEENWTPRANAKTFNIQALKSDSDEAYKAAKPKAAAYEKKQPGKPINFLLELNPRFTNPVWRVIWGESIGTSNFSVFVDASTGEYLQTMH